jgi:succinyl-CoA synthetase alpha subunit
MAILVDSDTRLLVQGLTGREGSFHAGRNKEYGTNLVAGVTPGKGGADVDGTPVFDTVADAVQATAANTSLIFVPARFASDAVLEAYDAGIDVIVAITENIPAMDMARVVPYLAHGPRRVALIGPNCPGLISPGHANVGIIPGEICMQGPVGLVSRSGTLTYQIIHELTQRGIGQSTCVGIGGDPIPGSDFIDVLERFEADAATELVVLVGEIGGDAEERAASWAKENMSKPVVAYIAGLTAPPGKRMGHAGAIISGSKGTAAAKIEALRGAGIEVGANPTEVAEIVARIRG